MFSSRLLLLISFLVVISVSHWKVQGAVALSPERRKDSSLHFMVIGDWGYTNQSRETDPQMQVARAMEQMAEIYPIDVSLSDFERILIPFHIQCPLKTF